VEFKKTFLYKDAGLKFSRFNEIFYGVVVHEFHLFHSCICGGYLWPYIVFV